MLNKYEAAFEADLEQYYNGMDLADYYRGLITPRKLSVCLMYMPRGANIWQCIGGAQAITTEAESIWLLEHTMMMIQHAKAGGKGKKPEMRKYPEGLEKAENAENYSISQAEKFRQKQLERAAERKKATEVS